MPDKVETYNYFGNSVSIDGNYAVVGSEGYQQQHLDRPGAAFIYKNDEFDNWALEKKITGNPLSKN